MVNPKAAAKREQQAIRAQASAIVAERRAEDAYWKEAGEGAMSKAQQKRAEDDRRRAEAAKRKSEGKALASAEAAEMASYGKKQGQKAKAKQGKKLTVAELMARKAKEKAEREAEAARKKDEVGVDQYAAMLDVRNSNRDEVDVEASGIDDAVAQLVALQMGEGDAPAKDMHPEKRVKAAFMAFLDAELPALKASKPGLRENQYREMAWKAFRKSPNNPLNQQQ
eukprot:PRCOL_00005063-RA